jgi:ABC-2 type transport system permease protein
MRNIWTICRRELYSYFVSPVAWVVLAIFAVLSGVFTALFATGFIRYAMQAQMQGGGGPMNVNEQVIVPLLSNVSVISIFFVPLIGMRLFAEEKRQGTFELLATSPATDSQIVIGKWLASVVLYGAMLLVLLLNCAFFFIYGNPDWKPFATGFLGLLLQGSCLLAFMAFVSSTTKNQIVAGAAGFGLALVLWVLNSVTSFGTSDILQVLGYISILGHYESFSRGVLDSKDVIYYCSMIFLGLFLTTRSLESVRWRA